MDAFGGLQDTLEGYRERRTRWLELVTRLEDLEAGESERLQRLDLVRFQVGELEEANPSALEAENLRAERSVLRHASELGTELGSALHGLSEAEDSALDLLRRAERTVTDWSSRVPDLEEPAAGFREASLQLEEACRSLGGFLGGVDADPGRLQHVEDRLGLLERLERKYGTDVTGLEERLHSLRDELDRMANGRWTGRPRGRGRGRAEEPRGVRAVVDRARGGLGAKLQKSVEGGLPTSASSGRASMASCPTSPERRGTWRPIAASAPAAPRASSSCWRPTRGRTPSPCARWRPGARRRGSSSRSAALWRCVARRPP